MIHLLITTGKKPDKRASLIAKTLFFAIPGSKLENRGQRTLQSLVSRADHLHFSRLCAVYMGADAKRFLAFLSLEESGKWKWLSPKILIKKVAAAPKSRTKLPQSRCLRIAGPKAKTLQRLLSPRNSYDETESRIVASPKKLAVFAANKKLLELDVEYEK